MHLSTVAMAAKAIAKDERVLDRIRAMSQRQVEEILAEPGEGWESRFAAGPAFREKFERARALLSGKHPDGVTPEQLLEAALDEFLKRRTHSPGGSGSGSRAIPAEIRRAVRRRDGGRCTFLGSQGRRCGSTWDVEVDHVKPFCRGGKHGVENLQLLCSAHNRWKGTAWMASFHRRE